MSTRSEYEDIGCLEAIEFLYAWLDNELDKTDLRNFEHHLSHCKSCWSRSKVEKSLTEHIKKSAGTDSADTEPGGAPPELQQRLQKLLSKF